MNTTLISGGAAGADSVFFEYSQVNNYNVVVYRPSDIKEESYESYDKILKYINETYLHRKYPTKNQYVNNLLRRDLITSNCDIMYAVSWFEKDSLGNLNIHGGTAWALWCYCSMMITSFESMKNNGTYNENGCLFQCYIFDQNENNWYQVKYTSGKDISLQKCMEFIKIDKVPSIKEFSKGIRFAGIGTRELNHAGQSAIQQLFI